MMSQRTFNRLQQRGIEPYWYIIILFAVLSAALFLYHLSTGFMPDRVAISIEAFQFNIYWYGIIITSGIALGAYVVTYLAKERAADLVAQEVPANVRERSIDEMHLPEQIIEILQRNGIETVGKLLLYQGFGSEGLPLNERSSNTVRKQLVREPGIDENWVYRPRWAQWNPYHVWNALVWILIFAVIGARLYHVFTPSPSMAEVGINSPLDYFRHPLQLINLRRGGLGIYGGIAGGALGLLIYARRSRMSAMGWADLGVIGVALGQYVGRWGNFFNQELYGRPTDAPWGITIEPAYRLSGYSEFARFHPAFLYESLWNLFAFIVLLTLFRRYRRRLLTGDIMASYLILYGIGRTLLETVRLDSRTVTLGDINTGLPIATLVSLIIAAAMATWIVYRHRRKENVSLAPN